MNKRIVAKVPKHLPLSTLGGPYLSLKVTYPWPVNDPSSYITTFPIFQELTNILSLSWSGFNISQLFVLFRSWTHMLPCRSMHRVVDFLSLNVGEVQVSKLKFPEILILTMTKTGTPINSLQWNRLWINEQISSLIKPVRS